MKESEMTNPISKESKEELLNIINALLDIIKVVKPELLDIILKDLKRRVDNYFNDVEVV